MKRSSSILWMFFIFLFIVSVNTHSQDNNLTRYLPKAGDIGIWKTAGDFQFAAGEDLFLLIDGGAEIYHEYGFKQVIIQEYTNGNGKNINLEIYEMEDPYSAFGVYSFKTGEKGEKKPFGNDSLFETYYLNFWKSNFLVTITGFGRDEETFEGLMMIAQAVDEKIEKEGDLPPLVILLPAENLKENSVKYIKGYLGLMNNYSLFPGNIFKVKEGVIGDYETFKLIILKYPASGESFQQYEEADKVLLKDSGFKNISTSRQHFVFSDRKNQRLDICQFKDFIVIALSYGDVDNEQLISSIVRRLSL